MNHLLRQVAPSLIKEAAESYDSVTFSGVQHLLDLPERSEWPEALRTQVQLPARGGGIGLRNSLSLSPAAYCASWADIMPALLKRYPRVLHDIVEALGRDGATTPCLAEVRAARTSFEQIRLPLPTWQEIAQGTNAARP